MLHDIGNNWSWITAIFHQTTKPCTLCHTNRSLPASWCWHNGWCMMPWWVRATQSNTLKNLMDSSYLFRLTSWYPYATTFPYSTPYYILLTLCLGESCRSHIVHNERVGTWVTSLKKTVFLHQLSYLVVFALSAIFSATLHQQEQ